MTYWENFYNKKDKFDLIPSNFAIYVNNKYCETPKKILELGCGDGRDAYYLSKKNDVIACDIAIKNENTEKCKFIKEDMSNLIFKEKFDIVYSRFSLHSIDNITQNKVISNVSKFCKIFAIECRSINDSLYGQGKKIDEHTFVSKTSYANEHYRRFIDRTKLENQLKKYNFKILESSESLDYAPYKGTKPCCLRIIASI